MKTLLLFGIFAILALAFFSFTFEDNALVIRMRNAPVEDTGGAVSSLGVGVVDSFSS